MSAEQILPETTFQAFEVLFAAKSNAKKKTEEKKVFDISHVKFHLIFSLLIFHFE